MVLRRHALARLSAGDAERRKTGQVMTFLAVPVVLSGYVVQVLTGDAARRWTGWGHATIGLIYAVGYALHPLASRSLPDDAPELPPEANHDRP